MFVLNYFFLIKGDLLKLINLMNQTNIVTLLNKNKLNSA